MKNSENLDDVWKEYQETKSQKLREKLILAYSPTVKYVAGRLAIHLSQHTDYEDLISYGIFGLIDAIDKFDRMKGVKFETYASLRIRGAIIDNIRSIDWVPRTLRQKSKKLDQAYSQLEAELGRAPTDKELAAKLEITLEETKELMKESTVLSLVSLDDYLDQNYDVDFKRGDVEDTPEGYLDKQELRNLLIEVIENLTERERLVVTLHYFEELTLREISRVLEVSESRISQLHTKALFKLQKKLGDYKSVLY